MCPNVVVLHPSAGKWFVSTGKDNLLNAWRTPYGASIFQVCVKEHSTRTQTERQHTVIQSNSLRLQILQKEILKQTHQTPLVSPLGSECV